MFSSEHFLLHSGESEFNDVTRSLTVVFFSIWYLNIVYTFTIRFTVIINNKANCGSLDFFNV